MKTFGSLTKKYFDSQSKKSRESLDYLFHNSQNYLRRISTIESECKMAYEHLQNLTEELQMKRLRYNAKAACKYFTL